MPSQPPPARVLAAFGAADAQPTPLSGGQGTSWRAGSAVFKPAGQPPAQSVRELLWLADVYSRVEEDGFRIARQRRALTGAVVVDGWCATDYVAGQHASRRWAEAIAAGERFHAALAGIARPAFLDQRDDQWATGDRVAWGEISWAQFAHVPHLPRLAAAIRPVVAPSQLIHGDLGGNVLYDDVLPPAVIDFSAYWRPTAFAAAIVVADALVWEGAGIDVLAAVSHIDDFGQYLIRALIYRAVTEWIVGKNGPAGSGRKDDPYASVVDLACRLATQAARP